MQARLKVTLATAAVLAIAAAATLSWHSATGKKQQYQRQQAEAGVQQYQLLLGERYLQQQELRQSVYWLGKAAHQGNAEAIEQLGLLAYRLKGQQQPNEEDARLAAEIEQLLQTNRQPETVLQVYQRRAAQGNTDVLISLGLMYRRGEGVTQDYAQARRYFTRYAGSAGVSAPGLAEYYLAQMDLAGQGATASAASALSLLTHSCELGYRSSCYQLGELYYQGGDGFAKDYKQAARLLDIYSPDSNTDFRAVHYVDKLLQIYQQGGHGIEKNPQRVREIKSQLCQSGELYGDDCRGFNQ